MSVTEQITRIETERDNIENVTAEELINLGISEIWESTLEKDGYRYIGTNPNNYICFGTTSQSECMNNLDKYMYRIIGIFEDSSEEQHLKLIKKEALEKYYTWNTDRETYKSWSGSTLFNGLNGNYFLSNTTYSYMQDSDWINKIVDWDYTATNTKPSDVAVAYYDGLKIKSIYLHEMNRDSKLSTTGTWTTVNAKIGAMYVSDYLLSLGEDVLTYTTYTNRSILNDGWMHLNENDYDAPNVNEWTMTRAGYNNSTQRYYMAWYISNGGYVDSDLVDSTYSVRPVFYLTSDVTISGEGTSTNPYIIS